MTFEKLAELVADDFQETMNTWGFETFNEMRRAYCWEMQDIKEEVYAVIRDISNKDYQETGHGDYSMFDDCSYVTIGWDDMSWGNFKKLIFSHLK